jgi:hypothetical protein
MRERRMLHLGATSYSKPCCSARLHPTHPHSLDPCPITTQCAECGSNSPVQPLRQDTLAQSAWSQPRLSNGIQSLLLGAVEFASGVVTFWWLPGDPHGKWAVADHTTETTPLAGWLIGKPKCHGRESCPQKSCPWGACVGGWEQGWERIAEQELLGMKAEW